MTLEAADDRCTVGIARTGAGVDDDIDSGQLMLMVSKRFANQALQTIASYRVTNDAGRNGQP